MGTDGRNTDAVSPRRRARTKRPTAWAKNRAVDTLVAYTPTASRGMSTPSDTIRTATIHRSCEVANAEIFLLAALSSDSTVLQGGTVAVDVVRGAALAAAWLVEVGDERDRVRVAAERRAGQREPAPRRVERLLHRVSPGQRVARVVDLVEDDQRAPVFRALPVQCRVRGDRGVGDGDPSEVVPGSALAVPLPPVDRDP